MFGKANLIVQDIEVKHLKATLYGEHQLTIENGLVTELKYHTYGESDIDSQNLDTQTTSIWAMGESEFVVKANEKISFSSIGESKVNYTGAANVRKGITIGENEVEKVY